MDNASDPMEVEKQSEDNNDVAKNISFYVFLTIRTAQLQHGLRHGDYERYRKYCTARLQRLRKKLNIASKKSLKGGKKLPKTNELSLVKDPRVLQIPLMLCERGWAYGMQKKGELAALGHYPKRRTTMITKFHQAMRNANELISLCEKRCDQRTRLEVEGYANLIKGVFYMEQETKYSEALSHFLKSKKILEGLARASEVEAQSVFIQAVEELEPNLRFCRYQLEKSETAVPLPSLDDIQDQLAQMEIKSKQEMQSTINVLAIVWRNSQFPIKNEKLSENLAIAQKQERQLSSAISTSMSSTLNHNTLLTLFEKIISAYTEMETNIKKALAAGGGVSVFAGEDLEHLQTPVVGKLLQHSIERTKIQIKRNTELFTDALVKSLSSKKQQELKTRSETLVRLHDTIIGLILEQADLGPNLGGTEGEALIEECTFQSAYYQSYRCYYLAHGFLGSGNFAESYALFDRCINRTQDAISLAHDIMNGTLTQLLEDLNLLVRKSKAFKFASQSEISASDLLKLHESQKQLEDLDLDDKRGKKSKKAKESSVEKYMADNLESWEAFAGSAEAKNIRLFKIPPPLYSIPIRPIVLDSALNHIKTPDLKHRVISQETGSALGRLWPFTGWGKNT
eukprot:g7122.t1